MSLSKLNSQFQAAIDPNVQKQVGYKNAGDQIVQYSIAGVTGLLQHLNAAMETLWQSDNPQAVIDTIEAREPGLAADVVQGHRAIAAFIVGQIPSLANQIVQAPEGAMITIDDETKLVTVTK
jgi:hypothetical protein